MSNFYDGFISQINNKIVGGVALEYFTKYSHFQSFIFVEGPTDIHFYAKIAEEKIGSDISFIRCGGKENVISFSNFLIRNNIESQKDNHYIVDKDYTSLSKVKPLCIEKISVTKYYGIENYAFDYDNLGTLLIKCELTPNEVKNIKELFVKFIELVIDFETIISMSTNNEIHDIKLKAKELDDVIIFESKNNILIKEEMKQRLDNIISSLSKNKKKLFRRRREELVSNYLNLRGHDLEMFFDKTLTLYNKEYKLLDLLSDKEILSQLKIDFDLK